MKPTAELFFCQDFTHNGQNLNPSLETMTSRDSHRHHEEQT